MSKGLRGSVDDALSRTGLLAVEKSRDFPTARPFAHKPHRALFVSYKTPEGQNQPYHRSVDRNWQGSTYQSRFSVQTNQATSPRVRVFNYFEIRLFIDFTVVEIRTIFLAKVFATCKFLSLIRCGHGFRLCDLLSVSVVFTRYQSRSFTGFLRASF